MLDSLSINKTDCSFVSLKHICMLFVLGNKFDGIFAQHPGIYCAHCDNQMWTRLDPHKHTYTCRILFQFISNVDYLLILINIGKYNVLISSILHFNFIWIINWHIPPTEWSFVIVAFRTFMLTFSLAILIRLLYEQPCHLKCQHPQY